MTSHSLSLNRNDTLVCIQRTTKSPKTVPTLLRALWSVPHNPFQVQGPPGPGNQETQRDALWVRGRGTETSQGYHDTKEPTARSQRIISPKQLEASALSPSLGDRWDPKLVRTDVTFILSQKAKK